ncbi:hypothetical protein Cgig2_015042 [Carnegiea gigantea]|uniref:Aminotransferase-like plant mobile domain-containing protein n=1 Tax=Carnegiea gigantea TaxID=171969 RepID=A0A9Q1QE12_9CARY|nr:hypothetical protein Cgig2_015042 [Carnegiea gigantea]
MEWTKRVLTHFEEPLKQAGIFGVVGVSQFPYHFDANVWWAFYELWGSLTNTLHHGAGEVGISLYNLEQVRGLPILGDIYEEFLPQNKDLVGNNKYPAVVAELLRIHAELYEFHKAKHIYYDLWLDHFYQEHLVYFAYGEQTDSEKEKVETKKRSPLCISRQKRMADLNIIAEGELTAFLTFWLSRFVSPHDKEVIRPETFVMTALMASRQRVFLAPIVPSYIYHGLGDAASNPDYPGKANTIFPIHYVIGWLVELFPCLYHRRSDSERPDDFPTLVCYARLLGNKLSLAQPRHIFRDGRYLSLRASSYREDSRNGRDVIDMGLPEEDSKFLLSIRSTVLPQRSMMDLAQAHADLQMWDTGAKFCVPPSYYEGLLASRVRVFQSLSALYSMIDIYNLSTIEICWHSSKIEEIFGIVETAVKIEDLVDIDWVKALSDHNLTCSSEITHIEDQSIICLIKVKEEEVLREEERIRKMWEDLNIQQQVLLKAEGELKSSLDLKKKEAEQVKAEYMKADLAEVGFSKLQDLEKEKNHVKSLNGSVIFFRNV